MTGGALASSWAARRASRWKKAEKAETLYLFRLSPGCGSSDKAALSSEGSGLRLPRPPNEQGVERMLL